MTQEERDLLKYAINIWERTAPWAGDGDVLKGISVIYGLLDLQVPYLHYYAAIFDIEDPFITFEELEKLKPCDNEECLWCIYELKELRKWYER